MVPLNCSLVQCRGLTATINVIVSYLNCECLLLSLVVSLLSLAIVRQSRKTSRRQQILAICQYFANLVRNLKDLRKEDWRIVDEMIQETCKNNVDKRNDKKHDGKIFAVPSLAFLTNQEKPH